MQQVVNDGILAVVAGSDTTSVALTCTVFCILTNPDCYAILQAEIDKFYPRGEDPFITGHHHHMPYLHAVMSVDVCTPTRSMLTLPSVTKLFVSTRPSL